MNKGTPGPGVIVLAAGRGTRMRSTLPKVLHEVCGRAMVSHVIEAARAIEPRRLAVVIGHEADLVREAVGPGVEFVEQTSMLGTGDAVERCREAMAGCDRVVVLNGDAPLLTGATIVALLSGAAEATMAIAVNRVEDNGAFGRVERDGDGNVVRIREADRQAEGYTERNAGFYVFDSAWLWKNIGRVGESDSGERYLTALAAMAAEQGGTITAVEVPADDALGVDDRRRLADAEAIMRHRIVDRLMEEGVTVRDPATTYIDAGVAIEADVTIEPGSHIRGRSRIATGSTIGPNTVLRNSSIGANSLVTQSTIEDSTIGDSVTVGPNAHVRGGTTIGDHCELGNYAEVKNSMVGKGVKMHHFSYLGDADVGPGVNYAAGAVTCNYDGVAKHRTTIGAGAFIGCDTMLVAPVTIGAGAVTGAGAVVTKDVGAGERVAGVPARPLPERANR